MRNLFKKSLAICLAIALCLTAMVGLTVSAEDVTIDGTLTTGDVEVEAGATSAAVSFTLAATDLSEVILSLEASEGATISDVAAPEGTTDYLVIPNADKSMVAFSTNDVTVVTSEATVKVTVTFAEAAADDAYTVTATLGSGMGATNKEELIVIADPAVANITVKEEEAPHEHDWGEGEVTTAPDCENAGVRTYTCSGCDETKTEAIDATGHNYEDAVAYMNTEDGKWYKDCTVCRASLETEAVVVDGYFLEPSILFTESVGMIISVNRAAGKNSITGLGYSSDYYFEVKYDSYDNNYVKQPASDPFLADEWVVQSNGGLVDRFNFTSLRLFEMDFDFDVVLYLKDADGRVVATHTQTYNICDQALMYAQTAKASNDEVLLKAIVDMVNYGAKVQEYFADQFNNSDIATAALPTVGFEEYQYCASTEADLPENFDITSQYNKLIDSTSIVFDVPSVLVGASTSVKFYIMAPDCEVANLGLVASYTNAYGEPVTDKVEAGKWVVVNESRKIYSYSFEKLALYDLDKTVTITVYHNDVPECNYVYNVGNFSNTYIDDADLGDVVVAMELFSKSAKAAIVR